MFRYNKILVCAPHTDDGEFGCGATLSRFLREKKEIYYVVFSTCEQSVPKGFARDVLAKEQRKSSAALGIKEKNLKILDFSVRYFPENRQTILEELVALKKTLTPDIVFVPALSDVHQDHATIAREAKRAFRGTTIFGYELPWNTNFFKADIFISVEKQDLEKKIAALACYKSQKFRHYADKELVTSLARVRGSQIAVRYAEAFELINGVVK
jgi:LmbE family N-acetylglucosaminyl deacetylase